MIAVPLGERQRFVVVGTPDYLERHGVPEHPEDLRRHQCIRLVFPSGRRYAWEFLRDGLEVAIDVPGDVTLDDVNLAVDATRSGLGLAFVYESDVREAIASGSLKTVLDDWRPDEPGLMLYYPSRRQLRPALRGLVEMLLAERQEANAIR